MGKWRRPLEDLGVSSPVAGEALSGRFDEGFWSGRQVLVTGHTGFKGSWLSLWLGELGAVVTGLSDAVPTTPSLYEAARVGEGIHDLRVDVRDFESLSSALAAARPEIVIHMAAQSLVRRSFEEPRETYETNVMGTVNVLEAVRRASGVRVMINVTSDKCYDNREWEWGYRECEPMGGHDPYSSSKGCSELVTDAFRRSFFSDPEDTRLASVRAGNVIGGGDWAVDRLLPDIMRAVLGWRAGSHTQSRRRPSLAARSQPPEWLPGIGTGTLALPEVCRRLELWALRRRCLAGSRNCRAVNGTLA